MSHVSARELIAHVLDPDSYISWDTAPEYGDISADYAASLARAREKSGADEAVLTGEGTVAGTRVAFIVGEFGFLGGSIGAATARRIIAGIHRATDNRLPLLISPSSGGTRMQEGTPAFALMISITTAVYRHQDQHLPYLVYLRHPTTGGVMASWGSAGHFTFAEPNSLLGFLGPRVVELTTGTPMPKGVQTGENLAAHGVIDGVVSPDELRAAVVKIIDVLSPGVARPRPLVDPVAKGCPKPASAWRAIQSTRRTDRPGIDRLHRRLAAHWVELSGTGDGRHSPAVRVALTRVRDRPVMIIAQDRKQQPPHAGTELGPAALRFARRGIALAHQLQLPLISIIDTPGAELSQYAEEHGMAGSIARTLGELVDVDVPTISVIMGQGCGGGALAMLPADKVLVAANGWLSPLPPEGASAIIYRDTAHAPEMMEQQGVGAASLVAAGVADDIIPECPDAADEPEAFIDRLIDHLSAALWDLEHQPERVGREQRFRHYENWAHTMR